MVVGIHDKISIEIILEAVSIIRKFPKDNSVLREQLRLIEKAARSLSEG